MNVLAGFWWNLGMECLLSLTIVIVSRPDLQMARSRTLSKEGGLLLYVVICQILVVLCILKAFWKQTQDFYFFCYSSNIDIFLYVTQYSACTRRNTLYFIILELIPTYTFVSEVLQGHFNMIVFIKARVAQSGEHQAVYLKVVGSSPTVSKNFSFCILSLSTRSW